MPIATSLLANTAYWLAYNTNATSPTANNLRYDPGVTGQWSYRTQTFGTWPSSFGPPLGRAAYQASVFITYAVSGPAPDTVAPSVSITGPPTGMTVSATGTVSADATDNVGVTSVQFFLDGQNLGLLDTTVPYNVSWNTALTSNGGHVLTARARDLAGNVTTSGGVSVTVSNASSGSKTLGHTIVAATTDSSAANYIGAWRFVMPNESGTTTSLWSPRSVRLVLFLIIISSRRFMRTRTESQVLCSPRPRPRQS